MLVGGDEFSVRHDKNSRLVTCPGHDAIFKIALFQATVALVSFVFFMQLTDGVLRAYYASQIGHAVGLS